MYDVAEQAGVSIATASRVLSGSSYPVKAETRQRVLDAAKALDFRPNRLARALVTARSRTIGAIVHDIADPYFAEITRGLEDAARTSGYQVFACSSDRDSRRQLDYVEALMSYQVDALVFAGGGLEVPTYQTELASVLQTFSARGGAVVLLAPHTVEGVSVTPDNRGGARAMTSELAALGHRRIGYLTGPPIVRTSAVRLEGYRDGLADAGLEFDPALVVAGDFTSGGGAAATAELLDRADDVTAIFAGNDLMALGVLRELASRGIGVPDRISVAGFDDIQSAAYVHPQLTTVRVPMHELGEAAVRMALAVLDGDKPTSVVLAVEVIRRSSTGPRRAAAARSATP